MEKRSGSMAPSEWHRGSSDAIEGPDTPAAWLSHVAAIRVGVRFRRPQLMGN